MTTSFGSDAFYYLLSARVPYALKPQTFGNWKIDRRKLPHDLSKIMGCFDYTLLFHKIFPTPDMSNIHRLDDDGGMLDIVMEDSPRELRKHLPIWLKARGRVLKTGLGLGCVVRGLLANEQVEHIDVIEIDADIIRVVGAEFVGNPRVTIHYADALKFTIPAGAKWDFAWHDIWTEQNKGLQQEHAKLIMRFDKHTKEQGAWAFPRELKRLASRRGVQLLGAAA